ncbi:MAG: PAS domain-containing protein [Algoriphagus aquaeductus]|uniref:PAS domain-containing protein n=1 Tax=Algoriphagus aquaeductus TaxID=475299 RepID=UPI00391CA16B
MKGSIFRSKFLSLQKPESVAGVYMIFGLVWITLSDRMVEWMFSEDIRQISRFQLFKGFFYVLLTSLLLYFLIRRLYDQISNRNQELELVFTNPDLGMLKLDSKGVMTELSANMETMTGYSKQELMGKTIFDLIHPLPGEDNLEVFRQIIQSGYKEGFQFQFCVRCKNGEEIIFNLFGMGILTKQRKVKSYIVAVENVTEQLRSHQNLEAKNKQIMELAFDQFHLVRAPLARIMAITYLLQEEGFLNENEKAEQIKKLKESSEELDFHVRTISQKMRV